VYVVSKKPGNFGAGDILACVGCDGEMLLTRRTPHPDLGKGYEEQTFTCAACERAVTRSVDKDGQPPGGPSN